MTAPWVPPQIGASAKLERRFTMDDVEMFARISGDRNPLHFDDGFAKRTKFGSVVVQGGLTAGLFNAIVAMQLPGPGSVFLHQEWDYLEPVYLGDTILAEVIVVEARTDKPVTKLECSARRPDGVEVLRGVSVVYTLPLIEPDAAG